MGFFSNGLNQAYSDMVLRNNAPTGNDVWSLTGRTLRGLSEVSGRVCNIVFIGQSTNNNGVQGFSSVSNGPNIFNLSIAHPMRDKIFEAKEPLLVSDIAGGHHGMHYADQLISGGYCDQVILTPIAAGGSYAADFAPGGGTVGGVYAGSRTGSLAYRIALAAKIINYAGLHGIPTIIDWQQGEWDSDPTPTTTANYKAALNGVIAEFRRVGLLRAGNIMFIHKCTRPSNSAENKNIIRQAQAEVVDGELVKAGADIDTLGAEYRHDGTHFNQSGAAAQAALKVAVVSGYLSERFAEMG